MECKVNKTYSPQQYSFMGILMIEKCEKREFSPFPLIEDDEFSPFLIHKTQALFWGLLLQQAGTASIFLSVSCLSL